MNDEMNTQPQSDTQADMPSTEEGATPEVTAEMPATEETSANNTEETTTEEAPATE